MIPSDDEYDRRVLRTFFVEGRIKQLPAKLKKRHVLLRHIVGSFERERVYREADVNAVLARFHEDVATLRREMVETGLMVRYRGEYARPD
jgi:ArsR family transcriptional regulator, arsenate/arsenite/antimonite-responsive transcriptional repressor